MQSQRYAGGDFRIRFHQKPGTDTVIERKVRIVVDRAVDQVTGVDVHRSRSAKGPGQTEVERRIAAGPELGAETRRFSDDDAQFTVTGAILCCQSTGADKEKHHYERELQYLFHVCRSGWVLSFPLFKSTQNREVPEKFEAGSSWKERHSPTNDLNVYRTDFLVIGSGLAGLSFAVKMGARFPDLRITVVTKTRVLESNTRYAQGGIAVVTDFLNDNFEKHKQDTLIAGDGLCDPDVVEMVVREGPDRIREVVEMGADFDRTPEGEFDLGMEGAHSARRILHYKDVTGFRVQNVLLQSVRALPNVEIREHHFAVDLITQHHLGEKVTRSRKDIRCFGAYVMNLESRRIETFLARATILASGGAGQVYEMTTNPPVATGDGFAMAYRAKALVERMQYVQFHPTALRTGVEEGAAFLISEAVRGFGAVLRTGDGASFMENYDERGSLASRDIVARAIDTELKRRGEEQVWLDCRQLDIEEFRRRFPNIYRKCLSIGIDVSRSMIPVAPAAHYFCGGVHTDLHARTSIAELYCCGETACTGLHGANRLASNSLLEALVFAHHCFEDISERIESTSRIDAVPDWDAEGTTAPREMVLINQGRKELRRIMSSYVGIVRSNERLRRSYDRLELLYRETEELYRSTTLSPQLCELRNMINTGYLVIRHSMEQKENVGTFYNVDIAE